jgi:hypothetical protein
MGRAELLALVIKVLKLIAPIALALALLAGTAPDACARGHGHSIVISLLNFLPTLTPGKPVSSTRDRPSGSREHGGSLLR